MQRLGALSLCAAAACGDAADPQTDTTGTATTGEPAPSSTTDDAPAPTTTDVSTTTDTATASQPSTTSDASTTSADTDASASHGTDDTADTGSTGPVACTKNVVVMGYWPPTNEMLRPWSTNPKQNPDAWIGADWGGYGYDVYAFFPEFPPDGDPTNDQIGDPGAVGSPDFDLRVDYQATTKDFWRIVDEYQPSLLLTTSRGGKIGWELEAIDGGHGTDNQGGPAMDWASDKHGAEQFPTKSTVEARTWDAISTYRQGNTLPSQLPLDDIFAATDALGITSVAIAQDTSGNFLSGFLALHGLYYNQLAPHNVAAGHIHVGIDLPKQDARVLIEATLHALLQAHPFDTVDCP